MLDRGIVLERRVNLTEVLTRVQEGERAILLIDGDHYVPLTGFDGENVMYNDSSEGGTEANKKKSLKRFMEITEIYHHRSRISPAHWEIAFHCGVVRRVAAAAAAPKLTAEHAFGIFPAHYGNVFN